MGGFESLFLGIQDGLETLMSVAAVRVWVAVLAIVFLWSGLTKLRRPLIAAWAIVDFKLVSRPRVALGRLLGILEFSIGAGLLVGLALPVITGAALTLLTLFSFLILRSLMTGRHFECACFGSRHELSWTSLARTGALATLAAVSLISVALTPESFNYLFEAPGLLEVVSASAVVGCFVLAGQVRDLLKWNPNRPIAGG